MSMSTKKKGDYKDSKLVSLGIKRIEWANLDMPVLQLIRKEFEKTKPLKGLKMSACLHITKETANLARTLTAGGADLVMCASNPLSTQDDVAAALSEEYGVPTYAIKGENESTYYEHLRAAIEHGPMVTMDDGADLVTVILKDYPQLHKQIIGSMEETTTGVIRLRAMEKENVLKFPVIAVNDADTKHLFDNRYGTGQSTVDGIVRATGLLLAGKTFVVIGYGWCGRGLASRAHGMGANIVVTEVNPIRALEAVMDGYRVMPMQEAAKVGDVFCSVTGNAHVIDDAHFKVMKSGALVSNSGHFNVEINIKALEKLSKKINKGVREFVDEYVMQDGRSIYLLGEGRLINLAAAEGHPASVMDMSFATQALATQYCVQNRAKLGPKVYNVPKEIDERVALLKLKSMGIGIDVLTPEQVKYLNSWESGT